MTILEEFDNDIRKMLSFAWCQPALNIYPDTILARISKSEASELDIAGDINSGTMDVVGGLNKLEKKGQASQVRGKVRRCVDEATYAILEARLIVVSDTASATAKIEACKRVARDIHSMKSDYYSLGYVEYIVAQWGNMPVPMATIIEASGKSERQERRDRYTIQEFLHIMFDDAVDLVEQRI